MTARLMLEERLDLAAAGPLAESLRRHAGRDLVLDAAAVSYLGALAAQVLLSAAKSWAAAGRRLDVTLPSRTFLDHLAELGLRLDDISAGGEPDGH